MAKQSTLPQIVKVDLGDVKSKAELTKIVNAELEVVQTILKVDTAEERQKAHDIISNAKKVVTYVGEERMKVTRILDAKKKEFTEIEKEIVSPINEALERAIKLVKEYDSKVIEQQKEQLRQQQQNEEAERQRKLAQQQESEKEIWERDDEIIPSPAVSIPTVPIIPRPKGVKMVKDFKVTDFSKVPDKYKVLENTLVRAAMKLGTPIEGIEYFEKPQTSF